MDVFPANDPRLIWQGRILEDHSGFRSLVGSASSLRFRCYGNACTVRMQNVANQNTPNYISFVIDGKKLDRIAISSDTLVPIVVPITTNAEFHDIEIYKETEPYCGHIRISTVEAAGIGEFPSVARKRIEFIGNSIMAGMGADMTVSPCGEGNWCDQHNAYDAFGTQAARALNCEFTIAAVSGMGMYRNWNTDGPVMKDVYESIALSPDTTTERIDYGSFRPDVIAICVGANDLSDGDGMTPRLPFDTTKFIEAYLSFMSMIHAQQPQAKWLLLNSPVNDQAKDDIFRSCLTAIRREAPTRMPDIPAVELHFFDLVHPAGCDGHPDVAQHTSMATELTAKLRNMIEGE